MKSTVCRILSRAASTTSKEAGDISSVFPSLSGKKPEPLPPRFSLLKKSLINGKEDAVVNSWNRLTHSLQQEIDKVKARGSQIIPNIEYADVVSGKVSQQMLDDIRLRGTVVIRNVVPRQQAMDFKSRAEDYIAANRGRVKAFPADDPAVYELYWSPSQVEARSHPNMLETQSFLGRLWHSSDPKTQISTTYPLTYADRFRIRRPGDAKFALGPHSDGGALERWEDREYSSVYQKILDGKWEDYDPFDAKHRVDAKMSLYDGGGACSMYRLFQGWLALSKTGPGEGTLKVCPLLKHATAYFILRPFLDPETDQLNIDTSFPGSAPGCGQEYSTETHPGLELESTMVSMPKVEPGDYVAWHCDSIHSVDKEHKGNSDSSVMYIPTCPMTKSNLDFLERQRMAALSYSPPPDFPGAGGSGELGFEGAVDWNNVSEHGLRAMGLGKGPWDTQEHMSSGERRVIEEGNMMLFA